MEESQILKNEEDKRIFFGALLSPPSPNERLKMARLNYLNTLKGFPDFGLKIEHFIACDQWFDWKITFVFEDNSLLVFNPEFGLVFSKKNATISLYHR